TVTATSTATATTVTKTVFDDSVCFEKGASYAPAEIVLTNVSSPRSCMSRCLAREGITYFTYYPPMRTCQCSQIGADKVAMSGDFIAGEVECGGGRTGCFVQDAAYAPIVLQVQLYAVDAYACQRLLRNSNGVGDFFVYYPMLGLCDFVVAAGSIESFSKGAVSGEKSCAQTEVVVMEKDDAEVPQFGPQASAPFGLSGLVMLAGALAA
ncbi:unnamed protein product, partial [Polarella glacialis]